jgi:uncharacterized membrane protein YedE/YeeE
LTGQRRVERRKKEKDTMKKSGFWSPYLAGAGLGLTLLATFVIAGRGLGASGACSLAAGVGLHAVTPGYAHTLKYFSQYLDSPAPLLTWNVFQVVGVFLGALAGTLLSGNFKMMLDRSEAMKISTRLFTAFFGGALTGFAARLARGCTSGVALTGGAQLAVSGWVFVLSMFAAGFIFAAAARRLWS